MVLPYIFFKIVWGHRWGQFLKNKNPIEVSKLPKSKIVNGRWNQFASRISTTVSEFCLGVTNSRKLTDRTNQSGCGPWYSRILRSYWTKSIDVSFSLYYMYTSVGTPLSRLFWHPPATLFWCLWQSDRKHRVRESCLDLWEPVPAHMGAILWQFHRAAAGLAYMYGRTCTWISHPMKLP